MTGKKIGYKRVSTIDQNPERQLEGIQLDREFVDFASGKDLERPKLQELLSYVREEDEVFVHSLDRLGRSLLGLKKTVDYIVQRGASIKFLKENLEFGPNQSSPLGMFLFHVMGAFAEFERSINRERQAEGIKIAKAKGVYTGGKPSLTQEQVLKMKQLVDEGINKKRVAQRFGVSRGTLYKYFKQLIL